MLSKLLTELKSTIPPTPAQPPPHPIAKPNKPIRTTYLSAPVPIPPTFLTTTPPDARPITVSHINWPETPIPEYAGLYAVVLDHVLSPSECKTLLELAEASVPASGEEGGELRNGEHDPWGPALVNVGGGYEVLEPGYRRGDRIVWDCGEVVGRVWERCLGADDGTTGTEAGGLRERFGEIGNGERNIVGGGMGMGRQGMRKGKWVFLRVNERMRFLRYGIGGFFKPHCDAPYADTSDPYRKIRTMFTIHLYLNDSKAVNQDAELVGGATTFYSNDEKRRIDVDPKAGRVLIFQHRRLLHSGDDVRAGTKYTVRTDIMYEFKPEEEEADEA